MKYRLILIVFSVYLVGDGVLLCTAGSPFAYRVPDHNGSSLVIAEHNEELALSRSMKDMGLGGVKIGLAIGIPSCCVRAIVGLWTNDSCLKIAREVVCVVGGFPICLGLFGVFFVGPVKYCYSKIDKPVENFADSLLSAKNDPRDVEMKSV